MNRIFKVVWNQALGTWMAVSELGNKNRKTKSSRTQKATLLAGALGMALAGAQAEEVTGEEIVDHGDRLEIRNLHQLKKHTDESGNETYESSGVFYNEKITGDTSLEISAPNVKYKKEKATDYIVEGNDEYHRGQDDRYGRGVTLETTSPDGNSYTGITKINHGVSLHVGKVGDKSAKILGGSNDLNIEGFTSVAIHSTETVKNLNFEALDHNRIVRSDDDVEEFYIRSQDAGYEDIWKDYREANAPSGGALYLDNNAHLTVEGKTRFVGGNNFSLGMQVSGATFELKEEAEFNRATMHLGDESKGRVKKGIKFDGHGSGISLSSSSQIDIYEGLNAKTENQGGRFFNVETGSTMTSHGVSEFENSVIKVSDSVAFQYDAASSGWKVNNHVVTLYADDYYIKPSTLNFSKNGAEFLGENRLDLIGSNLNSEGDLKNSGRLTSTILGSTVKSQGVVDEGGQGNLVIAASDLKVGNFVLGANSDAVIAGNKMELGALTLGENAKMTDATYRDGSEEGGRIAFSGDNHHVGLTYDEYVKVLAGKSSDSTEKVAEGAKLRYDIKRAAELIVSGDVTLEKGALYDAKGEVDINGGLDLKAEDAKFFVRGADAHVRADSLIHGEIGIDEEHSFNFNAGKTVFTKDQINTLLGDLNLNEDVVVVFEGIKVSDDARKGTVNVGQAATLHANGDTTLSNLNNQGSVYIGNATDHGKSYGVLTVEGNYEGGQGSALHFGKVNATGQEETAPLVTGGIKNLMVVKGDAKGTSEIKIKEVFNPQLITKKGILLVNVEGDASNFILTHKGGVTDGGVEYIFEGRKDTNGFDEGTNSWYLVNEYVPHTGNPGGDPIDGGGEKPTEPEQPTEPEKPTEPQEPAKPVDKSGQYSPEVGAYLANHVLGNIMFELKYHDRQYLPEYEGVWMHAKASFGKYRTDLGSALESKVDYYTIHLGKDLLDKQEYNAGVMVAYGYSDGNTKNHARGFKADHSSHGFALGLYGTYNFDEHSYLDAWAQYVFMRNSIDYKDQNNKYNSRGIIASIEAGHAFDLSDTLKLQPQAQITYMGVKADDYTDHRGTKVTTNRGNVQLRLGARLFNERAWFDGQVTPYAEFNYIHNTKPFEVSLEKTNLTNASVAGNKNLYQLEFGAKTELENNWTISGGVSFTKGKDKYRDTRIKLDLRYEF